MFHLSTSLAGEGLAHVLIVEGDFAQHLTEAVPAHHCPGQTRRLPPRTVGQQMPSRSTSSTTACFALTADVSCNSWTSDHESHTSGNMTPAVIHRNQQAR